MNQKICLPFSAALAALTTIAASRDARAQDGAMPEAGERPVQIAYPGAYAARLGPQLGARIGYAAGQGVVYSGLDVSATSNGALPLVVDLGWRFLPQLYAGLYGQFAPVFLKTNPVSCPEGFSCSAQDWRMGLEVDFHFLPRLRMDPYVGLSGGYEILHTGINGTTSVPTPAGGSVPGNVDVSVIDRGWEFASLTLGFDYRIDRTFGIVPFLTGTLSAYNVHTGTQTVSVAGNQVASGPVANVEHAGHELFFAGVRGTFNL